MGCASPRDSFCGGLPRPQGVPSPSRFRDGHHNFVVTHRRSSYLQDSFTFKIPRRAPQLRCDAPSLIIPTGFLHHCAGLHRRWSLFLETTSGGAAPLSVGLCACAVKYPLKAVPRGCTAAGRYFWKRPAAVQPLFQSGFVLARSNILSKACRGAASPLVVIFGNDQRRCSPSFSRALCLRNHYPIGAWLSRGQPPLVVIFGNDQRRLASFLIKPL